MGVSGAGMDRRVEKKTSYVRFGAYGAAALGLAVAAALLALVPLRGRSPVRDTGPWWDDLREVRFAKVRPQSSSLPWWVDSGP